MRYMFVHIPAHGPVVVQFSGIRGQGRTDSLMDVTFTHECFRHWGTHESGEKRRP